MAMMNTCQVQGSPSARIGSGASGFLQGSFSPLVLHFFSKLIILKNIPAIAYSSLLLFFFLLGGGGCGVSLSVNRLTKSSDSLGTECGETDNGVGYDVLPGTFFSTLY